jgi:hypothetical protein
MATWRLNRVNLPTQREQNSRWRPYNGNLTEANQLESFCERRDGNLQSTELADPTRPAACCMMDPCYV